MKRRIRLTESDLHKVIKESVKKVLKESKGKDKFQNSFKSKENMTKYRDMYEPNSNYNYYDNDNEYYDSEQRRYGAWGSGPYQDYSYTCFDDGYDYCGDDNKNERIGEYNRNLRKRLSTKGGQMSHDWDESIKNANSTYNSYDNDSMHRENEYLNYARKRFNDYYSKEARKIYFDENLTDQEKSEKLEKLNKDYNYFKNNENHSFYYDWDSPYGLDFKA